MISLLGTVLLVTASTLIGYGKTSELHARARILTAIVTTLELLRGEITTMRTPMPELAERFSANAPQEIRGLFRRLCDGLPDLGERSFAEIWTSAVTNSAEMSLSFEERNTLCLLGLSLGRYDTDEQESAIVQCADQFARYLSEARDTAKTQAKLYTWLGVAVGLMLAIVML